MARKLADILADFDQGFGLGRTIKVCSLLTLWDKVVDKRVSQHTEPVKIYNRVLFVSVSSPTWAQELTFLKPEIIDRFNQVAGQKTISDIKFKAGG